MNHMIHTLFLYIVPNYPLDEFGNIIVIKYYIYGGLLYEL